MAAQKGCTNYYSWAKLDAINFRMWFQMTLCGFHSLDGRLYLGDFCHWTSLFFRQMAFRSSDYYSRLLSMSRSALDCWTEFLDCLRMNWCHCCHHFRSGFGRRSYFRCCLSHARFPVSEKIVNIQMQYICLEQIIANILFELEDIEHKTYRATTQH